MPYDPADYGEDDEEENENEAGGEGQSHAERLHAILAAHCPPEVMQQIAELLVELAGAEDDEEDIDNLDVRRRAQAVHGTEEDPEGEDGEIDLSDADTGAAAMHQTARRRSMASDAALVRRFGQDAARLGPDCSMSQTHRRRRSDLSTRGTRSMVDYFGENASRLC
jgi:hypothetical protein